MFIIGSRESLYFKGFDDSGIAEFTLSRSNAKLYDESKGKIDVDFREIEEQCHLSDCRIKLYKSELLTVKSP